MSSMKVFPLMSFGFGSGPKLTEVIKLVSVPFFSLHLTQVPERYHINCQREWIDFSFHINSS